MFACIDEAAMSLPTSPCLFRYSSPSILDSKVYCSSQQSRRTHNQEHIPHGFHKPRFNNPVYTLTKSNRVISFRKWFIRRSFPKKLQSQRDAKSISEIHSPRTTVPIHLRRSTPAVSLSAPTLESYYNVRDTPTSHYTRSPV